MGKKPKILQELVDALNATPLTQNTSLIGKDGKASSSAEQTPTLRLSTSTTRTDMTKLVRAERLRS